MTVQTWKEIFLMKNDFLQIYLNGKNEFRTNAEFSLNELYFSNVSVKIDTGCPRTSFPIQKLGISSSEAYNMKLNDCRDDSIKKSISFGVNDSKLKKEMDKKNFIQSAIWNWIVYLLDMVLTTFIYKI